MVKILQILAPLSFFAALIAGIYGVIADDSIAMFSCVGLAVATGVMFDMYGNASKKVNNDK